MPRTLLVVDDIRTNRMILRNMLGDEYEILEAAHGAEALAVMRREHQRLSAVMLDLGMPVMDGYEVLRRMQADETLAQLPVIVTTGETDADAEEKALCLGAKDYISKPYKSAIIKQRIWNTINLRETAATVNALQRDRLTGLYSREAFFDRAAALVKTREPGSFIMACFDINGFKVINDQYGNDMGDTVLRTIADVFRAGFGEANGLVCRVADDHFAVLYPAAFAETGEIAAIRKRAETVEGLAAPIAFSIGRYVITDLTLTPSAMYDRAALAAGTVKGRFDTNIAVYDEAMRDELMRNQEIVTEMRQALASEQYEVWFQPQYNHATGALIGSEALVRWRHPERGLLAPAAFIPIFERNGFVYELDKYVWERVCRTLRKWLDEGRAPLPVSVNISRYDILRGDIVETLQALIARYRLPVELLRLEITESAFAVSAETIVAIAKQLIALGFTVEIDDFGSGYSSLNTLKDVPAQVIKLDMRFFEGGGSQRGGNILESIVRMAKWLGMSVIAEGVEEKRQADFLKSIGCCYVQGYLYARPMCAADYEAHCRGVGKEERLLTIETVENLDNNAFWDPASMDTLMFSSYVGAACIYEYSGGRVEMLRVTDRYLRMLGGGLTIEDVLKIDFAKYLADEPGTITRQMLDDFVRSKGELTGEFHFVGIPGLPRELCLRSSMRVIAAVGDRSLIYCISENITEQRLAEQSERVALKQLQAVMDSVNCGITAVLIDGEHVDFLFSNDLYYQLLGYTREQFASEVGTDVYQTVYPEDKARVSKIVGHTVATGAPARMEFRALRRDGSMVWLRCSISMTGFEGVEGDVELCTYVDITAERAAAQELLDNLPEGAALYDYDGERLTVTHLNKRYWELVDRAPVDIAEIDVKAPILESDRAPLMAEIAAGVRENRDIEVDTHILCGDGGYRLFHIIGRVVPKKDGRYAIYAAYTPITDESVAIRDMLPVALRAMMDTQTDFSFVKDRSLRYVCCSRAVYRSMGLASEEEAIGKSDADCLPPELAARYAESDRHVLETGEPALDLVFDMPSDDGERHVSSTSKFPLKDSHGETIGVYGVGRDVTEARAMRSQLELLGDNLPGGIAIYEGVPDHPELARLTYFNDGLCRLFGYEREAYRRLADENPVGMVFAEDLPMLMTALRRIAKTGEPMDLIYRTHVNGGGFKWINMRAVLGEPNGERKTINAVLVDVTEQQEALRRLRVSEEENRLAIEHSRNVVCRYDVATRELTVSPRANPIYGMKGTIADIPESAIRADRISESTVEDYRAFYEAILRGEPSGEGRYQRRTTNGWRWLEGQFSTIFSADGKPVSAVISFVDVTDSIEKEIAYRKWRQSLRNRDESAYSLFRCSLGGRSVLDAVDGSMLRIRFQAGEQDFAERTARYVHEYVLDEDCERFSAFLQADALLASYYQGKRTTALEYRERLPEGGFRWLRLTVDLIEAPRASDVEAYLLFEDVDAIKKAELGALERTECDPLTGAMNRESMRARVAYVLQTAKPGAKHALLLLGLDGFAKVNEAFGQSAGDQALIDVAESLRAALRHSDLLARLDGDRFAVLLNDIPGDAIAGNKAKQLRALTRRSFSAEVELSASAGIAIAPRDGTDFDTLCERAAAAMAHVKGLGRDSYAFYHEDMADVEPPAPEPSEEKPAATVSTLSARKRRMLIVDDNRMTHVLLTGIFAEEFVIEKVKDGNAAMIRLRHYGSSISVVLLDLMMPGMDGFEVLARMKNAPELRGIPVVVVSGDSHRETSLRAIRAGASDFVTKPVDPDVLRIRVQSAIAKAENERLWAKNSFLEMQSAEVTRYRTVLEHSGIVVTEYDWINGVFTYDPGMSCVLAGRYDGRGLWHILLADMVAETAAVQQLQMLAHNLAADRQRVEAAMIAQLRTPSRQKHWFRINAYKVVNAYGLAGKLYIAFADLGAERPAED